MRLPWRLPWLITSGVAYGGYLLLEPQFGVAPFLALLGGSAKAWFAVELFWPLIGLYSKVITRSSKPPADLPVKPAPVETVPSSSSKEANETPYRIIQSPKDYLFSQVPDPSTHAATVNASKLIASLLALSVIVSIIALLNNHLSSTQPDTQMCEALHKTTYHDVAAHVPLPSSLALVKCYRAGILSAISGTVTTADLPEAAAASTSGANVPFYFSKDNEAFEDGKTLETFNVWAVYEGEFIMRVANYTKSPISKIVVGFKNEPCGPPEQRRFTKLMMITPSRPILPDTEMLLKWQKPGSFDIGSTACLVVLGASSE